MVFVRSDKAPAQQDIAVQKKANLFSELSSNWQDLDKTAIETGQGQIYRYRDVLSISGRLANALAASGVKPGDRVAAQVEKSPEALFLYLACLRGGAAYLPLNTAYTQAELDYFLRDAEPAVFVCTPERAEAGATLCAETGTARCLTLGMAAEGTLMELAAPATRCVP
jgi:malonyl-CoA/methylmalonyl-CoA synthetase